MKNRHSLLEVGFSFIIFGLSMIIFPSIFEHSSTHKLIKPDNLYTGIFLIVVGSMLLLIKWIKNKKT